MLQDRRLFRSQPLSTFRRLLKGDIQSMEDENGGEDIGESSSIAAQSPEESSSGEFPVEKILDEQIDPADGQLKYKIRWQNYGPGDDSWEPASNIEHCLEIVDAWEATKAARQSQGGNSTFWTKT
jgi:hypothetical protein